MSHLEFLVEEPSAEAALDNLLPMILGQSSTYQIHVHQGKQDLLSRLPVRLRGYRKWLPSDWKIVVLIDEDRQDCLTLKRQMEEIAFQAGFDTKAVPGADGTFQVINRIAVEELEAWFLGDVPALLQAYPRIPESLHRRQRYRNPDAVMGGTWEALARLLVQENYYSNVTGVPKIEVARTISRHMNPARNRSQSFKVFYAAISALVTPPVP